MSMLKKYGNKIQGKYRDLFVQCDTFFLADVFENFRKKMY